MATRVVFRPKIAMIVSSYISEMIAAVAPTTATDRGVSFSAPLAVAVLAKAQKAAQVAFCVQQVVFAAVASPAILPSLEESLKKPLSQMFDACALHLPAVFLQHVPMPQLDTPVKHFWLDGLAMSS